MQPKSKRRTALLLISWAAVVLCCAAIFALSHETASVSSGKSNGLISLLLERFGIVVSSHTIRKTAHALEYCGLSLLLYHAYFQSFRKVQPLLTVLTAVLYATSDEIHQYFIAGRACQLRDVFVDFVGAAVGVAVCTVVWYIWHLQKSEV